MWNSINSTPYFDHLPNRMKQAATLEEQHKFLNPTGDKMMDYGIYGGGGALGGAAIGALINMLRDESVLKGALIGGGAGLGLGLGGKALADSNINPKMEALKGQREETQALLSELFREQEEGRELQNELFERRLNAWDSGRMLAMNIPGYISPQDGVSKMFDDKIEQVENRLSRSKDRQSAHEKALRGAQEDEAAMGQGMSASQLLTLMPLINNLFQNKA